MKISSRFSVAIHILSILHRNRDAKPTSEWIAGSVNTNPVVIRRITGMLHKAGLVRVGRGPSGTFLARDPEEITLLEIYRAVIKLDDGQLFHVHENPNPECEVGANIQSVIHGHIAAAQGAMEAVLGKVTLSEVLQGLESKIGESRRSG